MNIMNIKGSIDAVDLVDKLMTQFRYGVKPEDKDVIKAYELGISVQALKEYIEGFELEDYLGEEDDEEENY